MNGQALGLIETYGYIGAVEAADVCLKSANVRLIGVHLVKGGLVTVVVTGDVGAVRASMDASRIAAEKVARVISVHVIPRPAPDISKFFEYPANKIDEAKPEQLENENIDVKIEEASDDPEDSFGNSGFLTLDYIQKLNSMKVVELRTLARQLPGLKIERNRIKFANRKELLEALLDYHERKS